MVINKLTNVKKWYLIVKCYRFIIQIDVWHTKWDDRLSHHLINYMKKVTEYIILSNISFCEWYR